MGLCKLLREQAKCERYEPEDGFDAVAAAIRKAGLQIEVDEYACDTGEYYAAIVAAVLYEGKKTGYDEIKATATGPTPTAALVAAVEKHNETAAVIAVAEEDS
jgi:hypothetical protein